MGCNKMDDCGHTRKGKIEPGFGGDAAARSMWPLETLPVNPDLVRKTEDEKIRCPLCQFVARTGQGLSEHYIRAHRNAADGARLARLTSNR